MIKTKNILVSTTPDLASAEIKAYLGVVSSHVVAGTNLFSDIFASLSDVFGGRSETYQRQLTSINDEVIALLKDKALKLGANCIVGLSIDHDEVSGGNKSMFMVTAVGTAVRAEFLQASVEPVAGKTIDAEAMQQQIVIHAMLEKAKEEGVKFGSTDWQFVVDHRVTEFAPFVLKQINAIREIDYHSNASKEILTCVKEYFSVLPQEFSQPKLYEALSSDNDFVKAELLKIIGELGFLDLNWVVETLRSDAIGDRKLALQLLNYYKSYYTEEDYHALCEVKSLVESGFPLRGERFEKKQMLSAKTKTQWNCECGYEKNSHKYCESCKKDIFGFFVSELNPEDARKILDAKLAVLRRHFH